MFVHLCQGGSLPEWVQWFLTGVMLVVMFEVGYLLRPKPKGKK